MTKLMTRDDYQQRKADLAEAKRLAEDAFKQAAFQLSTKSATQEDVDAAKHHATAIDTQIEMLEATWVATQEQLSEDDKKRRAADWKLTRAAIASALADRRTALNAFGKTIKELAFNYQSYIAADATVLEKLRPWCQPQQFGDFRNQSMAAISPEFFILGLMKDAGIRFDVGINVDAARDFVKDGGHLDLMDLKNGQVLAQVDRFKPESI
jgi:hypothetical protein